jgi:hypothetical protein
MRRLADVPARASALAAVEIKKEIDKSFQTKTDPYGKTWPAHAPYTVRRWGKHPLLQLTGAGKAEIKVRSLPGSGIAVESPSEGLAFAQGGTVNEPKRRFLPENQLSATWKRALERATAQAFKEATDVAV